MNTRTERNRAAPDVGLGFAWQGRAWNTQLNCWAAKIQPGEFYITSHPEAITTVLGSCISACIRDPGRGVGGMNHFMLPEDTTSGKSSWLNDSTGLATRYGSYAMETLINALLKMGARRERLEVKLFGGGHVLNAGIAVGERNIEFARHWLATEGLPIVAEDVGGTSPRSIVYFPQDGRVKVKHLRALESSEIASRERDYLGSVAQKPVGTDIELFED
jgi:chemotaxis protein CheD